MDIESKQCTTILDHKQGSCVVSTAHFPPFLSHSRFEHDNHPPTHGKSISFIICQIDDERCLIDSPTRFHPRSAFNAACRSLLCWSSACRACCAEKPMPTICEMSTSLPTGWEMGIAAAVGAGGGIA